jgi:hypothetical protein
MKCGLKAVFLAEGGKEIEAERKSKEHPSLHPG